MSDTVNNDTVNETEKKLSEKYKDTLNLPQTDFPMKANLAAREPELLKIWESERIYQKIQEQRKNKTIFYLPDGPPYANGAIHLGHAVNKILKDIVLKSKLMKGMRAPFVPGWDCHGLPIELNVEKKFGKAGKEIDAKSFREKCREYVNEQINSQRASFKRLGVLGDWEHPYRTMDYAYEANIVRALGKIIQNGHLHKGYKPVHWCIDCGSALAEAEVEYANKTSDSIDVLFKVVSDHLPFDLSTDYPSSEGSDKKVLKPIYAVIWTTTPWTLPANEAVAVHPEHVYVLVETEQRYLIIVKDLLDSVLERNEIKQYKIISEVPGSSLAGLKVQHPFYDKQVPIVEGDHVTLDAGTGLVHTAPAHGQDDFLLGEKYQLPLINPVGPNGCYVEGTPLLQGLHVFKANARVIDILKEHNTLLHQTKIEHSYPHCWRHKSPLIFRATQQWFISMEQKHLREHALKAIDTVQWIPNWGYSRIYNMVAGRPDWCISRQRTWGVPLCLFVHKITGEIHPDTPKLIEKVAQYIEKEGIDAWYDLDAKSLIGDEVVQYEKINDTLDVWFDSGVQHFCVHQSRPELSFPADLYLEGSDQHRGWFMSSLTTSVAMNDHAPYRQALTHGFTVDAQGHKMSKSLGNTVAPDKVVNTLGADVLRLWVAATDYSSEMAVSDEILKRMSDTYRRIRNTARYLLANLNGFDPYQHKVPVEKMVALDKYIVQKTIELQKDLQKDYESYQFHLIYQKLHNFCSIDLGSFYLDIIKDRQYTGKKDGLPRRSAQTALFYIAEALVRWMAPILTFTAEEIWKHLPAGREASVFLSEWFTDFPKGIEKLTEQDAGMDTLYWQEIITIRDEVNKSLEAARAEGEIGSGLEAEVSLYCDKTTHVLLSKLKDELRFVLITSKATIFPLEQKHNDSVQTEIPGLWIQVKPSNDPKCVRCWHRRSDVNAKKEYPGLCGRCVENVAGEGEVRLYA